ncbi:hypothetical protein [Planotetraspora kaengkrachanensis]|uniref:Uncharacterized protein n=1 Tax=Planotetraspora kaengkrachanensis TaxID=575193 RepID=A0A8J3M417_9ACTN|nr:hypothetical protein [Planotetraspora kaengkrachanensis]GIG79044.1 hypothetical protein Pka01_21710 [Planotetraspora kaengkrachanensis]
MTSDIGIVTSDVLELLETCFRAGWTDGLPVIPPTALRVAEFVEHSGRKSGDLIAEIPPLGGAATVEKIAANAVMAGCVPEHMPVLIAALEAATDPAMNIGGIQCSTHMASPLMILHGPIRNELGINSGANTFGQGVRANATLGRALKLALVNIGGSRPGETDKATLGQPGKFSFCIGENEEASPWPGLHVDRGLRSTDSAVTLYGAEGPQNINNQAADNPFDILKTVASMMTNLGSNHIFIQGESFVVLCPEHAQIIASSGWTKADVQHFLFQNATRGHAEIKAGGIHGRNTQNYTTWPRWVDRDDPDSRIPVARRVTDIVVIVAGGPGRHSAYLPGWGTRSVTRKIEI